jgi:CRP/FNR family transcriptional regulator, cyclic AMP receptor protein
MPEQAVRLLKTCALFDAMTPDELDVVFRSMRSEAFPAGSDILTEGLTYHGLWVLVSGRCEVVKGGPGKRSNRLAVLEAGAVFGEMSFLDAAPHSASVRAMSDVDTMRLMRDNFEQLRVDCPSAADKIARSLILILSARLRRMDEWTCGLVENSDNERHHDEWQQFRAKLYGGLHF